jgi:lipoprotein-anchoring transpeptidase ErfK/SrfK
MQSDVTRGSFRLPFCFALRLYCIASDECQFASTSMQRSFFPAIILAVSLGGAAAAQPLSLAPDEAAPDEQPIQVAAAQPRSDLGGGFIEFLFDGGAGAPRYRNAEPAGNAAYANTAPATDADYAQPSDYQMDPRYLRQEVEYHGSEAPGTIVIDTPNKFLYLVEAGGKALRYGVGVGRPGFTWAGVHTVSAKKEWPDWVPPEEMLERQPGLPHFMAGGPNNPLGARAMYLGSTLYRIHGSNEPWTIGHNVSSGCIRMRNADVIDLYGRVKVGTKVVVL